MHFTFLLFLVYLITIGAGYWLRYLNLSWLKTYGGTVPPEFEGSIDAGLLKRISDYTFENNRVGIVESIISNILLVVFVFGGMLGIYDRWISSLSSSFVLSGLLFALFLLLAEKLLISHSALSSF
jgi:STE24 endopeptidase